MTFGGFGSSADRPDTLTGTGPVALRPRLTTGLPFSEKSPDRRRMANPSEHAAGPSPLSFDGQAANLECQRASVRSPWQMAYGQTRACGGTGSSRATGPTVDPDLPLSGDRGRDGLPVGTRVVVRCGVAASSDDGRHECDSEQGEEQSGHDGEGPAVVEGHDRDGDR